MEATTTKTKYIEAVGRRKTSNARARLTEASKNSFTINDRDLDNYFKVEMQRKIATEALVNSKDATKFKVTVHIAGGGMNSQAEAMRHAIARALIKFAPDLRGGLKKDGFLKRDPRAKERRKFGLKKARKAPQWSKR